MFNSNIVANYGSIWLQQIYKMLYSGFSFKFRKQLFRDLFEVGKKDYELKKGDS